MVDLFNYEQSDKSDLNAVEQGLLDYLKANSSGKENAVKGKDLMLIFGFNNTAEVRKTIKKLRISFQVTERISSCNNGYYIPYEDEFLEGVGLLLNKTLSMIQTVINQFPASAKILWKAVGYHYKKTDKALQGQTQIRFTGHEQDFINRYAKKYEGERK